MTPEEWFATWVNPGSPLTDDSLLRADAWKHYIEDRVLAPGLRIGEGSTVTASYEQRHARQLFAAALHRLVPDLTDSLLTAEGLTLSKQADIASAELSTYAEKVVDQDAADHSVSNSIEVMTAFVRAREALDAHIHRWQDRYRLTDEWVNISARTTLAMVAQLRSEGTDVDGSVPLLVGDPQSEAHRGRTEPLSTIGVRNEMWVGPRHEFVRAPLFIDDLKWPDIERNGDMIADNGFFSTFDPRTETVDKAVEHMLPVLEIRLRRALERIIWEDHIMNETKPSTTFRSAAAFEWLVRYQVRGESKRDIARVIGKSASHVPREVNRAATLVGLELRDPRLGRPRRKTANVRKMVR